MTSAFRTTALTAALAMFSCGTFAAALTLDFNALGKSAVAKKAPITVAEDGPVSGVYFDGAWAYDESIMGAEDPAKPGTSREGGFLINRARGSFVTTDIVVSLDDLSADAARVAGVTSAYPSQFISLITFSLYTGSQKLNVKYFDADGNLKEGGLTSTDGSLRWSDNNVFDFTQLSPTVRWFALSPADDGLLGIDNLQMTLTDPIPGGGGTVPEPASYALVGLALLAAGSASRRRT